MAVDHVKSTTITGQDGALGIVSPPTAGKGGGNYLKEISGFATALVNSSVDATYQLVRVPSAAKVKEIIFESAAQVAGAFDIGVYYATDGRSGPSKATSLLAANAVSRALFASAVSAAAAVPPTDVTNESLTYTIDKRVQPLWQAAGLTTDPGGFLDIVATVTGTAVTTGTGVFGISVRYTE